jgi:hypothetical protein
MTAHERQAIRLPSTEDIDSAPQLTLVALADATLLAVDRALDSAHPILAATSRFDRPPPVLITSEHLAALLLIASAELSSLLRDYSDAMLAELHGFGDDDDASPPF